MRGLRRSLRLKDVRDECLDFYLPVTLHNRSLHPNP
jgi:hypothetical protein